MSASSPEAGKESLLKIVICQRHQLLSIAKGILRCPFLAEDVVQDAALKVTSMDFDQRIQCPLQFAKSMVRNLAIDQVRRRRLESDYLTPETDGENHTCPADDPYSRLEAWEAIGAVFSALYELPGRTQHAFERVRIEGIPQKNVAAELGVSPTLVHFMVWAAHQHCLARLQSDTIPKVISSPADAPENRCELTWPQPEGRPRRGRKSRIKKIPERGLPAEASE